ncbi:hypothetical protein ACNGEM_07430 [Campylobacter coli]
MIGDHTLLITHVWGTKCNLKCDFCLNEGYNNLEENREKNFKIADVLAEISNNFDDIAYVDHGGELLYCSYFQELFNYKIKNIKNYRSTFFTNGTSSKKYIDFMESEISNYLIPFLSYHLEYMNNIQYKNFFECCEYLQKRYSVVNIALVYHKKLGFELFKEKLELLKKYNIKIKVFFDFKLKEIDYYKSFKYMNYLDNNFKYYSMCNSELFKTFAEIPESYLKPPKNLVNVHNIEIECVNDFIRIISKYGEVEYKNFDIFRDKLIKIIENYDRTDVANVRY